MRIVFFIYDFVSAKLPLQPWLTVYSLSERLAERGHDVYIVSDIQEPASVPGATSLNVASLRGSNAEELRSLLVDIRPDALVMLPTPLNISTSFWLDDLDCRRIGFASYPFYNFKELLVAARCIGLLQVIDYVKQLLVPKSIWARAVRRHLDGLVAQSSTTSGRLLRLLDHRPICHCIPPGVELSEWPYFASNDKEETSQVKLLYMGAAIPIRGFDIALQALALVPDKRIRLRILARGADSVALDGLRAAVVSLGIESRVDIEGGWIDRARLIDEIHAADVVLQPFVLVPSELPVTAMEVIACGTPVIGSAIDGMPSTIGSAGTVVAQGNPVALARAIESYANDSCVRDSWRMGCIEQRRAMLGWDEVTSQWEALLYE